MGDTNNTPATKPDGAQGFTPITSQEQFDQAIGKRVSRAKESARKEFMAEYAEQLEKAAQFDALQEANKSELQKAQEEAAKSKAELDRYKHKDQLNAWADEVSKETGIPANVLRGNSLEELKAHAEALKSVIPQKPAAPVVNGEGGKPMSNGGTGDWLREMINNK